MPDTKDLTATKLNLKQEKFCELYATDAEFFGNGAQSYIEAYGIYKKDYASAKASAARLLSNVNILKRIDEIMEHAILNDQFVDKQLAFLIAQNAELGVKVKAIGEYNKLRARITSQLKTGADGEVESTTTITYMPKQLPDDYFRQQTDNNSK